VRRKEILDQQEIIHSRTLMMNKDAKPAISRMDWIMYAQKVSLSKQDY
jgi:hypothetical protein